ncbi:Thiamine pyrophosphate-requiring enzymes [hydrothermal vent metagenome]|uniref:Thiamine pyrophosphate-requiring enzymes n=1 Tax=hydrothermal vent metagenome TaxID=652676 RepID=A0A3B0ZNV5_9ZZZZ
MKLCDAIVETLKLLDVRYLFGISGANIEHLHDAVHRRGEGRLVSVLSKTETGAAFMADCHARVHRKLGVCCATSGGGMMNLIVGVAESYAESVPVLALVGQPPSVQAGCGAFQDSSGQGRSIDALAMWRAATKYCALIDTAEQWWEQFTRALCESLSGRPGPSALLIPRDKFEMEVGEIPNECLNLLCRLPASPALENIHALFSELHRASKPVLIFGQGVRRSFSPESIAHFAELTGIPVVVTPSARAEYPNNARNFLGICGIVGLPSVHEYLEEQADLYILVGTSLDMMSRGPLNKCIEAGRKTYSINIDPDSVHIKSSYVTEVTGDAGMVFEQLLRFQESKPYHHGPINYRKRWVKPKCVAGLEHHARSKLLLSEAINVISQNMPERGHIVLDAGNCAATALHLSDVPKSMSSTIALGMGGMGYSIAGAIGAQLGSPSGTKTIVFVGDAAFLMTGFELNTAIELKLPILFIIFNNNMHGMCAVRQQIYFDSRYECINYTSPVDFPALARSLGGKNQLWSGHADTKMELEQCMKDYYNGPGFPGLLEINLGPEEIPPFLPFLNSKTETTEHLPT